MVLPVEVEPRAALAAEAAAVDQLAQDLWDGHALREGGGQGLGDVQRDVEPDLVEQAQRAHRHAEVEHRPVDEDRRHARLEEGDASSR